MIDFFNNDCIEAKRSDIEFGICDDQDGKKAYTDSANFDNWIAIVKNDNKKDIVFTAIDNCIILYKEGTNDEESTCDGMLSFEQSLFLVELKIQGTSGWLSKATSQLENTAKLISEHNDRSKSIDLDLSETKKLMPAIKDTHIFTLLIVNERKGFMTQQDLE